MSSNLSCHYSSFKHETAINHLIDAKTETSSLVAQMIVEPYNALAICGMTIAKIQYLFLYNVCSVIYNPTQTYTTINTFLTSACDLNNYHQPDNEKYLTLGNHPLFKLKMKKLNPIQLAMNKELKIVDWNTWIPYEEERNATWYLNINELRQLEPSHNRHRIQENIKNFIDTTKKYIQFADEVIEKTKNDAFNLDPFKCVRKIQCLATNEIFSFSSTCTKSILISGDKQVFIQGKLIGEGTYKTYYKGKNAFTHQKIAICRTKILDDRAKALIEHNATVMGQLKHIEGVMQIQHHYTAKIGASHKKVEYMMVELCKEGDLFNHLGKLSLSSKIEIGGQIVRLIKHMHDAGYIYGDLKCENILLNKDNQNGRWIVYISDFDMSHKIGETFRGGSLQFMSPERLSCVLKLNPEPKTVNTIQSEIFELGLLLIEMFKSEGTYSFLPWDEKILQQENGVNILKNNIKDMLKEINQDKCTNPALHQIYQTITAMLNPNEPLLRPPLHQVIEVFENAKKNTRRSSSLL